MPNYAVSTQASGIVTNSGVDYTVDDGSLFRTDSTYGKVPVKVSDMTKSYKASLNTVVYQGGGTRYY